MMRFVTKQRWLRLGVVPVVTLLPLGVLAKTSLEARYPYDPACPWGRLSNGKGMLHRCLSEQEAVQVTRATPLSAGTSTSAAKAETKAKPDKASEEAPSAAPELPLQEVQLSLGPIVAEQGDITIGRLDKPLDRYKACVMDNGGLSGKEGTLVVKFLVRAEAERAEGASVDSFSGLSEKAAKCVADVVDRRQVGSPSADVTGAKLHFKFTR